MEDKNNPVRALLDKQDWAEIYARVVDFATHRTKSPALAKDLAQTAITRVFAYDSKWDPAKEPDLLTYLMSVVNMLRWNDRTSAASRRSVSLSTPAVRASAEAVSDGAAFSEAKMAQHDLLSRRMTLLTERLAGDAEAHRLVELLVEGVDSPTDLRARTGWSAEKVLSARRRMLRAAAKVAQDIGSGDPNDALACSFDSNDSDDADSESEVV